MKMNQVCELTGLADHTVRYYIEEGLISAYHTENYMGRKAYDFTEADVTALNNIATLRKIGFTVEEIRQLMSSPMKSQEILAQVRQRKEEAAETEQETFTVLDRLSRLKDYTVSSLVEALGEAAERAKLPPEKYRPDAYDLFWMAFRGVGYALVMLAPVAFLIRWLDWFWTYHRYAVCEAGNVLCILLALVPTAVLLCMWLRPEWNRKKWKAWGLCLLYLPFSWSFAGHMLGDSMTTDIRYYRVWDYTVTKHDGKLNRLFPQNAQSNDATYFYRAHVSQDGWDIFEHEVYAAWTLPAEQLQQEVERVDAMFSEHEDECFVRHVMKKGTYTCWIMDLTLYPHVDHDPFAERWNGGGYYMMFAFDAASGHVRYGAGNSVLTTWPDFPHFREVVW